MIDFHSHILPQVDDGSESVTQSLEMLKLCAEQGIDTIIATPHFYRRNESVKSFIERRNVAFLALEVAASGEGLQGLPKILLGAEVHFYEGINYHEEIDKLVIEGSHCLLLEMPFERWNRRIFKEVYSLSNRFRIVIAHVEEYLRYQNEKRDFYELIEMGAILQVNTSGFRKLGRRRIVLDLLKMGNGFVLGTDCHNMAERIPDFSKACEVITEKLGRERLGQIDLLGRSLLADD